MCLATTDIWGVRAVGRPVVGCGVGDKIRLLGFTTLHDTRRYAIPQCWAPHTQTQRHGVYRGWYGR